MSSNKDNTTIVTFSFPSENINYDLDYITEKYQFVAFICGVVYVVAVFQIKFLMKDREKFALKRFAVFWNVLLMIINVFETVALLPHLVDMLINENFYLTVCKDKTCFHSSFCGFGLRMFPYVKILELGDTILLVLQKRKLVTYYWCHHFGALIVTWIIYPDSSSSLVIWLGLMISASHVLIYFYGTARSLKYSVPRIIPELILISEVLQMIIGVVLCSFVYYYIIINWYCDITVVNNSLLFFMYFFCFVLSAVLYYKRFFAKKITEGKSVSTLTSVVSNDKY